MIDSSLHSGHHFYVIFFEPKKITKILDMLKLFKIKSDNLLKLKDTNAYHFQIQINELYGSVNLLEKNRVGNTESFIYDFYIGQFEHAGKVIFYLCYPYHKMHTFLQKNYSDIFNTSIFYKPKVTNVIEYFTNHTKNESDLLWKGITYEIIKYNATIKENQAKKIQISGDNPLNSLVYTKLKELNLISIVPTSLKMRCTKEDRALDVLFDRSGNYRFWMNKNNEEIKNSLLSEVFLFFLKSKTITKDLEISKITEIENES